MQRTPAKFGLDPAHALKIPLGAGGLSSRLTRPAYTIASGTTGETPLPAGRVSLLCDGGF
jgi:hypothetical protein